MVVRLLELVRAAQARRAFDAWGRGVVSRQRWHRWPAHHPRAFWLKEEGCPAPAAPAYVGRHWRLDAATDPERIRVGYRPRHERNPQRLALPAGRRRLAIAAGPARREREYR